MGDSEQIKYRRDVDGLRAIAVLAVVAFHAFPSSVQGGFLGVDIFFVISGYLISTIIVRDLAGHSFGFVDFYSRRIRRIFPALLLLLVSCFVFGWFNLLTDDYKQLGKHIAGGAFFVSNFLFWNETDYFANAAASKPLLHLWSLGIEEQFYIFWPLILWFAWKGRLNLVAITVGLGVASFVLYIATIRSDAVAAFYSPLTRFWELLAGSALVQVTLHGQREFSGFAGWRAWWSRLAPALAEPINVERLRNVASTFGVALIVIGIFAITQDRSLLGWWTLLPTLGTLLVISAGAKAWLNRTVLSSPMLVGLGLISYPLYLWHWPLLLLARAVGGPEASVSLPIVSVCVSVILAWLTYKLVEKPIRFGKHSRTKTIVLLLAMSAVGYSGFQSYRNEDMGFRPAVAMQEIVQYKYDYQSAYRLGTCLLTSRQDYSAFSACPTTGGEGQNRSLMLWGDSHAAHLYPGYKFTFGKDFKIIQRTVSGCAPILNLESAEHPRCEEINTEIFASIKASKPDKLVLAGNWGSHDWRKLEGTIFKLRQAGVQDIDLIGPVPQWLNDRDRELYLKFKSVNAQGVPERMTFGLDKESNQLDLPFSDFARELKVNYISPMKILCNVQGCIARVPESGNRPIAWDYGHLTEAGSLFLVVQFKTN
jgi:peptidoglycan/LPS O-acetylase OafA/YrhL